MVARTPYVSHKTVQGPDGVLDEIKRGNDFLAFRQRRLLTDVHDFHE